MEGIIAENTIIKIAEHVDQITSVTTQKEFEEMVNTLFDNEEHLIEWTESIRNTITKRTSDAMSKSPQEATNAIAKNVTMAILVGFLAERYTRDTAMPINDDLEFKRDYDSIEMFLDSKMKIKGLKDIATEL
jgi:hypothetical protein